MAVLSSTDRLATCYVVARPGTAELAFTIEDHYHGQGIGSALLRHLVVLARQAGLKEFTAEVLADNTPMLRVFAKSGLSLERKLQAGVVQLTLRLGGAQHPRRQAKP